MGRPLKIAVAEPSLIIRSGLLSVLRRLAALDVEITEISDISQLDGSLCRRRPDVLIINPAFLGMFSLRQLKGRMDCDRLKYVALQNGPADDSVLRPYDEVISIYDSADRIREKLLGMTGGDETVPDDRRSELSEREKEIVVGVVKGMSNKQIAEKLFLSVHTVITHRRNIAAKLQIHSPAGLTIYAIVNKLVELNDVKETIRSRPEEE